MKKKCTHYVDLIDFTITTGKVHPFYKGFKNLKMAKNYVKNNLVGKIKPPIFVKIKSKNYEITSPKI